MCIHLNINYQWDPAKADLNNKKHGIDFADAVGVIEDEWALTMKHEIVRSEQRFATVGADFMGRIVVVAYAYRANDIRIILARSATKVERNVYEQRRV